MTLLGLLSVFIGSLARSPWSQWWNQGTGPARMPMGTPPMDYTVRTQPELLASFSDAIGPDGITPRSLRDFVASTVTITPGGVPPTIPLPLPGWTTATRPDGTNLVGPAIGYNYTLRQIDMWDDQLQQWVNPAFQGGLVGGDTEFAGNVLITGTLTSGAGGIVAESSISAPNLAASCLGQGSGTFWNNGQTVSICP